MAWRWLARIFVVLLASLAAAGLGACDEHDDGTDPAAAETLPELKLTKDTPDVLFTWIDDKGATHTAVTIDEIPEKGRAQVRVVTKDAGNGSLFYVANLSSAKDDGSYPVRSMARSDWEGLIARRRQAASPAPPPTPSQATPPSEPGRIEAVVYGASWCKPCDAAAHHLESRGIAVKKVDVEKEPRYAREMQRKLQRAGKRGGSIPVIDVGGIILQGYNSRALDQAIAKLKRGANL